MSETLPSFTSNKLDLLDALSVDPRINGSVFRVAFRLAQHVNSENGLCFPSQERLAVQLGMDERSVRNSINRLAETNWLKKIRRSRGSNRYEFVFANVNPMLDRLTSLNDTMAEQRADRKKFSGQKRFDRKDSSGHDRKDFSGEHLNRTPEILSLSEISEGTYPRETIPTDHSLFGPWIRMNIPDPTKHRAALRLLHEGKMTPELLKRLAA